MPDGTYLRNQEPTENSIPDYLSANSNQYGRLEKAGAFVYQDFEPADDETANYVSEISRALNLPTTGLRSNKYLRCLSDVLMAIRVTPTGKIAWPMGSENYYSQPYGYKIAEKVRASLLRSGLIALFQRASRRDKLARLYSVDKSLCPEWLRFKKHGQGPLVIVKTRKFRDKLGQVRGGSRAGRKHFLPAIKPLEDQVLRINQKMLCERLCDPTGRDFFVRCYRVFNNGSLHSGGRLYGRWQTYAEEERLDMTISGEPVVEIDIKASFLSMAHASRPGTGDLGIDPYLEVPFVAEAETEEERIARRRVIKLLINAYFFKPGELTQFPKGKKKDEKTGKIITFKKQHGLKKPVGYFMDQIHSTFPFLQQVKSDGMELMFRESQVMIDAIDRLLDLGVVSFPVHDCLIVKGSTKDLAVKEIQEAMKRHQGFVPTLDISWLGKSDIIETEVITGYSLAPKIWPSTGVADDMVIDEEDNFDLLEG